MSCHFQVREGNFKLSRNKAKDLIQDIMVENKKQNWEIVEFENLKSINTIFDFLNIKIINNDLDNTIELDEEYFGNDMYQMYNMEAIFGVIAKYVDTECYMILHWAEYEEKEKWVFKNKHLEIYKESKIWEVK